MKNIYVAMLLCCVSGMLSAGNPDRQGEAGAAQLLMIPWARTAGFHAMNTSMIGGVEAMRVNVAGLSRINRMEVNFGHTIYLNGAGINFNSFGLAQRMGKNGTLGISLMAIDFGDINITTDAFPEGIATFSPRYFNIGLGYSHMFANKVSVGLLVRGVSEGLSNISAFGFALDAGVQYVSGERDNFKLGIALRNIGGPMKFEGEGLSFEVDNPNGNGTKIRIRQRVSQFELPSLLNLGASYDFYAGERNRITILGNFTSNSFSRDNIGGGAEIAIREMFMVRASYRYEIGGTTSSIDEAPLYTGLAAGATLSLPLSKSNKHQALAIDYAYRTTKFYQGSHNIGIRFNM